MVTQLSQLDLDKSYTYEDYLTWNIKERVELIMGRIFRMTPAPSRRHQEISGEIYGQLYEYLKKKPCNVYSAPFDVRFFDQDAPGKPITNNVQPDISVICDRKKLDERGCLGAPDLIVEILSPSTTEKDLTYKYDLYESHGVREYWVVSPGDKTLQIYTLESNDRYRPSRLYVRSNRVFSTVLEGFSVDLSDIFQPFDWEAHDEAEKYVHRI